MCTWGPRRIYYFQSRTGNSVTILHSISCWLTLEQRALVSVWRGYVCGSRPSLIWAGFYSAMRLLTYINLAHLLSYAYLLEYARATLRLSLQIVHDLNNAVRSFVMLTESALHKFMQPAILDPGLSLWSIVHTSSNSYFAEQDLVALHSNWRDVLCSRTREHCNVDHRSRYFESSRLLKSIMKYVPTVHTSPTNLVYVWFFCALWFPFCKCTWACDALDMTMKAYTRQCTHSTGFVV